jgi:hypothetical protein
MRILKRTHPSLTEQRKPPMLRAIAGLAVVVVAGLLSGCATLNGSVPFKYAPRLATGEPISQRIGMEKFDDIRPSDDRDATSDLPNVDEQVTAKLLEDFRASQLFERIDFPARTDDGLIMRGKIKRFYWKNTPNPVGFIPVANFALYFGAPARYSEAVVTIQAQLIDPKNGRVLSEYEKTATRGTSVSMYNVTVGEFGAELADAFREVARPLKDAIAADARSGRFNQGETR